MSTVASPGRPSARLRPLRAPRAPQRPGMLLATLALVVIALVALAPGLFTSQSPTGVRITDVLQPPGTAHWFGTDQLGRDVFARVLYGARPSVLVGLGSTAIALAGGTVMGLAAALGGRWGDWAVMRFADVVLALPPLLLALLAVVILGTGELNLMFAVAIAFIPGYARIVRAEALVVVRSGYVEAAVGLGLRRSVLIVRHVLPNALGPLLVLGTVGIGMAMLSASSLSFLGLGVQPPVPEWGALLSGGRDFFQSAWWLGVFPGVAVTVCVITMNVVGRYGQERFTKRSTR
ncbi:ABC transporter permease [Catenulispora yoronensis]|uniref:ABC transporter permease n=1 Tax=Catenulispora yoronensis TaxID=450799 RepID=A0ABN2VJS8_9ACTN